MFDVVSKTSFKSRFDTSNCGSSNISRLMFSSYSIISYEPQLYGVFGLGVYKQ